MARFWMRSWTIRKLRGRHVVFAAVGLFSTYLLLLRAPTPRPSPEDVPEDRHPLITPEIPAYSNPSPTLEIIPFHIEKQEEIRKNLPTEVAEWILGYRDSHRLVIMEPTFLQCLLDRSVDESCQKVQGLKTFRFALMAPKNESGLDSAAAGLQQIANQNSDWTFEDEKSSTYAITLSKSDLTVFISILEERKNYWFIHGSESSAIKEPSRMFTRLNLAQLVIGDHNQTGLFAPYPVSEYVWQWGKSTFLDCDRQSLDIFLSKYSDIQSVDESKKQSLVNIMAHLRDVLDNMRMTLMLTDATALGWYRECDLRLDSGRVDLSFLAKEWKPELVETLKMDGVLKFGHLSGEVEDSLAITVHAGNFPIHLYALYENKNLTNAKMHHLRFRHPPYTGVCATDLKGQLFYVRCDMLCSIVSVYGPKWQETKDFNEYNWAKASAEDKAATECWDVVALLHSR